ncbi:hypothetical protein BKA81DRAFT_364985 [Phyllosticta paracitricarpa]
MVRVCAKWVKLEARTPAESGPQFWRGKRWLDKKPENSHLGQLPGGSHERHGLMPNEMCSFFFSPRKQHTTLHAGMLGGEDSQGADGTGHIDGPPELRSLVRQQRRQESKPAREAVLPRVADGSRAAALPGRSMPVPWPHRSGCNPVACGVTREPLHILLEVPKGLSCTSSACQRRRGSQESCKKRLGLVMGQEETLTSTMWVPGDLFLAQNRQGEHRAASSHWRKVRRYKQSKRVTGAGDQRERQRAAMTGEHHGRDQGADLDACNKSGGPKCSSSGDR